MSKVLAINGGKKVTNKPYPVWPIHDEKEHRALDEVLDSNKWCIGAYKDASYNPESKVGQFQRKFAKIQGAKYGVAVANGTAALEIALRAAGIGTGDEVIVPPYTFISTASAVLQVNAVPVFCDIEADTYCIDVKKAEKLITKKTKAIIPVHFTGHPADMDALAGIKRKYGIKIIADACHAWWSSWKGKKVGGLADLSAYSFQMSKNIAAGEGGIILTNDENLADMCWSLHHLGRKRGKSFYEHYYLMWNYRMTEFQGALLLVQLGRLEKQSRLREKNALYLTKLLSAIEGITPLKRDSRVTQHSYHSYIFRYDKCKFENISMGRFLQALNAEGIPVWKMYGRPLYKNPLFIKKQFNNRGCPVSCPYYGKEIDYAKVYCPVTEEIALKETVYLPQQNLLGNKGDMEAIAAAVIKIKENIDELKSRKS